MGMCLFLKHIWCEKKNKANSRRSANHQFPSSVPSCKKSKHKLFTVGFSWRLLWPIEWRSWKMTTCLGKMSLGLCDSSSCTKTFKNTRFFERCGKQHGHKQHAQNVGQRKVFDFESSMDATWIQHAKKNKVLELFWNAEWTQHEGNMQNKLGQHNILELF